MEPRRNNPAPAQPSAAVLHNNGGGNSSILNTVLVVLLIITSIVVSAYTIMRLASNTNTSGAVKGKQYQALFLTNGQVYFGHLSKVDSSYVQLKDIYYLQVQSTVQPSSTSSNNNQNVSLAKLGSELHGPEDVMYVSREQVLFWENLKDNGKVVQAIQSYQKNGK